MVSSGATHCCRDEVEARREAVDPLLEKERRAVGLECQRHVLRLVRSIALESSIEEFARHRAYAEAIVVHLGRGTYAIDLGDVGDFGGLVRSEVVTVDGRAVACEVNLLVVGKEGRARGALPR